MIEEKELCDYQDRLMAMDKVHPWGNELALLPPEKALIDELDDKIFTCLCDAPPEKRYAVQFELFKRCARFASGFKTPALSGELQEMVERLTSCTYNYVIVDDLRKVKHIFNIALGTDPRRPTHFFGKNEIPVETIQQSMNYLYQAHTASFDLSLQQIGYRNPDQLLESHRFLTTGIIQAEKDGKLEPYYTEQYHNGADAGFCAAAQRICGAPLLATPSARYSTQAFISNPYLQTVMQIMQRDPSEKVMERARTALYWGFYNYTGASRSAGPDEQKATADYLDRIEANEDLSVYIRATALKVRKSVLG